ncbi:hypothetical protein AB1Y20_015557 [Prymnesium parvum]|uniref:Mitochondrial inner membrane protease subunit n=1 Tax=Prymnesium parvum TaxID=97485 RepID=A0AB34JY44_PRYPA
MLALPLCTHGLLLPRVIPRPLEVGALQTGMTVIPTLARTWDSRRAMLEARGEMMAAGLYPGVDYTICALSISAEEGTRLTLRPAYALVAKLERDDWPITVPWELAPNWLPPAAYNRMVAAVAVLIAVGWLGIGALLSSAFTLSVIPSDSMAPTVVRRDVLLVDKVSPRLGWHPGAGELVLFRAPEKLAAIIATRQPASSAAAVDSKAFFLKRVVARAGEQEVGVAADGTTTLDGAEVRGAVDPEGLIASLVTPRRAAALPPEEYFVLGDNQAVSIDSRCWGTLSQSNIVGKPMLRIFPPERFGAVE